MGFFIVMISIPIMEKFSKNVLNVIHYSDRASKFIFNTEVKMKKFNFDLFIQVLLFITILELFFPGLWSKYYLLIGATYALILSLTDYIKLKKGTLSEERKQLLIENHSIKTENLELFLKWEEINIIILFIIILIFHIVKTFIEIPTITDGFLLIMMFSYNIIYITVLRKKYGSNRNINE